MSTIIKTINLTKVYGNQKSADNLNNKCIAETDLWIHWSEWCG
ncbi:hypothetical protein EMIT079MI2_270044 [Bacillus sp. IT-79MI2]